MHLIKIIILILVVVLIGCSNPNITEITINENKIKVEIADEPVEQQKGLMYRKELCEECGMIFIFEKEQTMQFWMKNTLIPLDMIFIAADGHIVDIQEAEPCEEDPCQLYTSKEPAQYVLELNKGYSAEKGIKIDDSVEFSN